MTNLANALSDLRTEVLAGAALASVAGEIAAEYGVHPALLARKFAESYRSEDALRATATATSAPVAFEDRTAREVERVCKMYRVSVENCRQVTRNGDKFTVIGQRGSRIVAVRHKDGWHCEWRA
jgi:hypothetical protein